MKRGTRVRYRAIAGDVYDGVLACGVRQDGTVAVDIIVPGWRHPVEMRRARWKDTPAVAEVCVAWPKPADP